MVDSKHQWKAWLYLAPAIILLLIFTVWPIVNTLIMAFSDGYSNMEAIRELDKDNTITVYGTVASSRGGVAKLQEGAKFYFGEGVEENDEDLIEEVFENGSTNNGEVVAIMGTIVKKTDDDIKYDSSSKTYSFSLAIDGGYTLICNGIKEMEYDFDLKSGQSNIIHVTGVAKNAGKTAIVNGRERPIYTMEDATYVADINLSGSKRSSLTASDVVAEKVSAVKGLELNESTEQITLSANIYNIEKIVDDKHVTLLCQVLDDDGNEILVECVNLNASERTGLKFGKFFAGINNFKQVVNYAQFGQCLLNTMLLTVLTVPLSTLLALLIAVCLNAIKPLKRFLQTIFFLPYVTNSIAIGMVFATMFNIVGLKGDGTVVGTIGIINNVIEWFGGTRINWINQGSSYVANIAVMVIYIVWNALPFKILILLGGLQSVNKQYYDAAKVDGTSRARTFWRITVPLLSPMIVYVVITGFIGGFKEYSSIVGVFGDTMGPPAASGRLNTMVGFIYDAIASDAQGKASAAALILFGIILVVTLINLKISKKSTHY